MAGPGGFTLPLSLLLACAEGACQLLCCPPATPAWIAPRMLLIGALDDGELLEFGASPADVLAMQQQLQERRDAGAAAEAGTASAPFVPRAKRRQQIPTEALPKVAIVGRPNVGKSALFNRIAGAALAVVYDYPGVTRDRLYTRAFWGDKEFVMVDTGGLMSDAARLPEEQRDSAAASISAEGLPAAIERQAAAGVAEADVVLLLVDGQAGLQAGDREILDWLRHSHPTKPVLLAVNKCESPQKADMQVGPAVGTGKQAVWAGV
jgi:small GTP-binding protein